MWKRQLVAVRRVALMWQLQTFSLMKGNVKARKLVTFVAHELKVISRNINKVPAL